MAETALGGNPVHTVGDLPTVGAPSPSFSLTKGDLSGVQGGTNSMQILRVRRGG